VTLCAVFIAVIDCADKRNSQYSEASDKKTSHDYLACDSIFIIICLCRARYMLTPVRPSHGWISQKPLKLRLCNF